MEPAIPKLPYGGKELPETPATPLVVACDAEFTQALNDAKAGDHIILKPGQYTQRRSLTKDGLVIRAETVLGTTIDGGSWTLSGNDNLIYGFKRRGQTQNVFTVGGFDNVIRRCDIADWVTQAICPVNGQDSHPDGGRMRLDYCSFHHPWKWFEPSKPEPSRVCIRGRSKSPATFHQGAVLEHLHFHDFPKKLGPGYNGQSDAMEPVPDGPSHPRLKTGWVVRWILVEDHVGRDAVIDIKGGDALYEHITLLNCPGGRFDLRMGSGVVLRDFWLGDKTSMSLSGGYHLVDGVRLDGGRIDLIAGSVETDVWQRPGGAGLLYQRPRNITLRGITGNGTIIVGHKYAGSGLPAVGTRIEESEGIRITKELAGDVTVVPMGDAPATKPTRMTVEHCGVTAPFVDDSVDPLPDEKWLIEYTLASGESVKPPMYFKQNWMGLPHFVAPINTVGIATFPSRADAEALIAGPERPLVTCPELLRAVQVVDGAVVIPPPPPPRTVYLVEWTDMDGTSYPAPSYWVGLVDDLYSWTSDVKQATDFTSAELAQQAIDDVISVAVGEEDVPRLKVVTKTL